MRDQTPARVNGPSAADTNTETPIGLAVSLVVPAHTVTFTTEPGPATAPRRTGARTLRPPSRLRAPGPGFPQSSRVGTRQSR